MNRNTGHRKPTFSHNKVSKRKMNRNNSRTKRDNDSFKPTSNSKRHRNTLLDDDVIDSDLDSDYAAHDNVKQKLDVDAAAIDDAEETAAEKRFRIAQEHLQKVRALVEREKEEEEGSEQDDDDQAIQSKQDTLVANILQNEQLEWSGRLTRQLALRVSKLKDVVEFQAVQKHRQSVTAIALTDNDERGFSASKDGTVIHWDVETGKKDKYLWPGKDCNTKDFKNDTKKQSKHVLALAVNSDGRYLATGGLDRLVHLWDTRTREHIQAFQGHKGPVSCLTFRDGTPELYSGSFDRMIKWWNVEDRCHVNNLFGHQAEVLMIDCLHKERILSVARDRTLRLFKVLEESSLRFSTPLSALESCCFINNENFLSGSDDGNVELWNVLRRKPTYIVKNAHAMADRHNMHDSDTSVLCNGIGTGHACSSARSWVSSVAVCKGSDLAASGAGNGLVRLWAVESEARSLRPLYDLPLVGFVNSLVFSRSGRFLLAGVGQEPRLGRWGRIAAARNGVALLLSE